MNMLQQWKNSQHCVEHVLTVKTESTRDLYMMLLASYCTMHKDEGRKDVIDVLKKL
jgi:hypothetical protein